MLGKQTVIEKLLVRPHRNKEKKRKEKENAERETSIQNRLLLEPPMPLLFLSRFPLYLDDLKAP